MSFVQETFIPSGVYTIINVKHDRSITCRDKKRLTASSTHDYKWTVDKLSDKKWFIKSSSEDISVCFVVDLEGEDDPKPGEEVMVHDDLDTPRPWVIRRQKGDIYTIYSPMKPKLFWSLPDPGAPLQVSLSKEASLWKFKTLVPGSIKNPSINNVKPISADRPTRHPSSTVKHKVTITIPPGWLATVSADSVKNYTNLIIVKRTINNVLETQSLLGTREFDGAMILEGTSDIKSCPFQASNEAAVLELIFFHSSDSNKQDPLNLPKQKDFSSNLHVTSMERPDDMRSFPENILFTIFDQASRSIMGISTGRFFKRNVATASIRFTKKQPDITDPGVPEPGTVNPGYAGSLDQPRPIVLDEYLGNYNVVVVVDDSGSMIGQRWVEVRAALAHIASEAMQFDADGITISFLNSRVRERNIATKQALLDVFDRVRPRGRTPTGASLKRILDEILQRLDGSVKTAEYTQIKPLDIIVLTDGVPSTMILIPFTLQYYISLITHVEADTPEAVIKAATKRLDEGNHHPNAVGIQFLQIGNDDGAEDALKALCRVDSRRMVETVPYVPSFTPERLTRVILGTLHPSVRAKTGTPK